MPKAYMRSLGRALLDKSRGRFMHLKDLVSTDILKRLTHPARPMNFDRRGNGLRPQTEMHSFVTGRKIAAGCRHCRHLRALRGYHLHLRSDRIPVASVPDELQSQPVVLGLRRVVQNVESSII